MFQIGLRTIATTSVNMLAQPAYTSSLFPLRKGLPADSGGCGLNKVGQRD